jgi:TetR/AcrR family fatty acid metabolism transcriptional regulator
MRTSQRESQPRRETFTQLKRRDQLVECAIDAIVEVGFQRASVGEVARRAGVSKGVVTYHFAAKDDLIAAVIDRVIQSMADNMRSRLWAAVPDMAPEEFISAYITVWVEFYRSHARDVLALVRVYNSFRDESGLPHPAFAVRAEEIAIVEQILRRGQAAGRLGDFSALVMATAIKAVLDDLLTQFTADPDLDLEAHGAALIAIFERATRPDPQPAARSRGPHHQPSDRKEER